MNRDTLIHRLNLIPIAGMCLLWLGPMLQFWLAAWGPLRPFDVPTVAAPSWGAFLLGVAVSFGAWWLPRSYFKTKAVKRGGRVYRRLGVHVFRRYVTNGDVINRRVRRIDPTYRIISDVESMRSYAGRSRETEKGHVVLLVAGVFTAWYATSVGWYGWAVFLTAGNIVFNLYPVLLQRYTRVRIAQLLDRGAGSGTTRLSS